MLWRLRYRLTLQDLSEMFLERGIVFSYFYCVISFCGGRSVGSRGTVGVCER